MVTLGPPNQNCIWPVVQSWHQGERLGAVPTVALQRGLDNNRVHLAPYIKSGLEIPGGFMCVNCIFCWRHGVLVTLCCDKIAGQKQLRLTVQGDRSPRWKPWQQEREVAVPLPSQEAEM